MVHGEFLLCLFDNKDWATDMILTSLIGWGNTMFWCHLKMISTVKVLCISAVWCAEIITSNVISSPPSMWKKANIQWGMGIVSSQVYEIGWGSVDRFVGQFLYKRCLDCVLDRSEECRAHNLLKPKYFLYRSEVKDILISQRIYQNRDETGVFC